MSICQSICLFDSLSVCLSVKRVDCDKTKAPSEKSSIMTNWKSPTSGGALKMQDVKLQNVKMTNKVARHENAGHENDGRANAGHENAGHENDGRANAGHENAGHENDGPSSKA